MRTTRKPDLLVVLVVFVGLAFIVSGYIQYLANAHSEQQEIQSSHSEAAPARISDNNQIVTASGAEPAVLLPNGDTVNNSSQ